MIAFDYICPKGHITEHFLQSFQEEVTCGHSKCKSPARYHPSFHYTSRSAQPFSPVVIHKDAQGNVRFPGHVNARVPKGFRKVELTTIGEVRQFENEMNARDRVQAKEFQNTRQKFLDGQLAENRRALDAIANGGTWQGVEKDGTPVTRQGLSPKGKRFLDAMREVSRQRQERGRSDSNPQFYVEAFTNDASNRVRYEDKGNDWGHSGSTK